MAAKRSPTARCALGVRGACLHFEQTHADLHQRKASIAEQQKAQSNKRQVLQTQRSRERAAERKREKVSERGKEGARKPGGGKEKGGGVGGRCSVVSEENPPATTRHRRGLAPHLNRCAGGLRLCTHAETEEMERVGAGGGRGRVAQRHAHEDRVGCRA